MEKEEINAVPRVSPEETKVFVLEYIKNAYEQGRKYSEISRDKTKYGILQNLVNYHFNNILTACDVAGISPEGFVNERTIVKNTAENLTKQDVDNYIKQRHKGLNRGLTECEFKTDYYSKAVFNKAVNIYGSFALALRANSIRPSINTTNTLSDLKEEVISLFNNGVSGRKIEEILGISATSVYKILRESGIKPSEYLDKLSCNTASVTVGYMFEELLGEILNELGVDFKKYAHERWKPDFVVGNTWIDAKLTYRSGIFKTYEKYKECCEKVVFVYLIGPIEIKKFSDDYIKLSVYKLVENVKDVKIRSKFISKLNKLYQIALNSDERFVSPEQDKRNERIIELVNSGLSFHKIAVELGISVSTVSHVCSMYGVKSKAKRGRPKVKEVI